jgi:triosephosphate isomerase
MKRKLFFAGNWKMNKTASEAVKLVEELKKEIGTAANQNTVAVCPPFTALDRVAGNLKGSNILLGTQNISDKASGAYTGEISAAMLLDLGVRYVIIGHSERRQYYGETDLLVNKKAKFAIASGLLPIICIGETLVERESAKTEKVISFQFSASIENFTDEEILKTTIAYEPVWAIGTGKTATPQQAQEVHSLIRKMLGEKFGNDIAQKIIIQYGGSVKPENAGELMREPDIDGALVGGASLDAKGFATLIKNSIG